MGLAQRIGYLLTGGALNLLTQTRLELADDKVVLTLGGRAKQLDADIIVDALNDLAGALGRKAELVTES